MVRAVKVVPLADDGFGAAGARSLGGSGGASAGSAGRGRAMGKVPSLLFDVDDLGEAAQHAHVEPLDEGSVAEVQQKLLALLEPWSEPEYMLLLHVRFAREDAAKRGATLGVPELADFLRRLGYAVKMRTALGGGPGGACLRTLRHTFLTVSVEGPSGSMQYVLDPRFRDQFEIAHTTRRYSRVLEVVGPETVSSQDRLNKVVELLCSEMARAFQETGTPLPPWRQHAAMLSKWQPRRSEEVDLTAAMNNVAGQAAAGQAGAGNGGKQRLTGPSTVAQRLLMLGVVQQQGNPSPIAEGVEQSASASSEEGWESVGGGAASSRTGSPCSSVASSLHLDWEEAAEGDSAAAAVQQESTAPPGVAQAVAVPRRVASGGAALAAAAALLPPLPPPAPHAPRGRTILEGIRAAAAALPHRRNNTWAG